jgi:hypothetical protein
MRRRFLILVVLAAVALPTLAQNTASLPWWTSPVINDIGLSHEQTQKIRQVVRSYRDRLFDARNASRKAEADLQDIMNDSTVSLAQAQPAIERLARARANTTRLFTAMSIEIRAVLTQAQWHELVKRWDEVKRTKHPNRDTEFVP